MPHHVRGILFVDYVRILRTMKHIDWSKHLSTDDVAYLAARVDPVAWYPMDTVERMGLAILAEITLGALEPVRVWGSASIDSICVAHPSLLVPGNPRETLSRFSTMRKNFFDYPVIELGTLEDGRATFRIAFGMSTRAEEAATWQAMGFFDRLLVLSGARLPQVSLMAKSFAGDPHTEIALSWTPRG